MSGVFELLICSSFLNPLNNESDKSNFSSLVTLGTPTKSANLSSSLAAAFGLSANIFLVMSGTSSIVDVLSASFFKDLSTLLISNPWSLRFINCLSISSCSLFILSRVDLTNPPNAPLSPLDTASSMASCKFLAVALASLYLSSSFSLSAALSLRNLTLSGTPTSPYFSLYCFFCTPKPPRFCLNEYKGILGEVICSRTFILPLDNSSPTKPLA